MAYMLQVDFLVALIVFALAGLLILGLFAWTEAAKYANALLAMRRIAVIPNRESFAISRINSRNRVPSIEL